MTDGDNQFSKLPVPNLGSTLKPGRQFVPS